MMNNAPYFGQQQNPQGFAMQSGLAFNNVTPPKSTSSTQDELNIIKSRGGNHFCFDAEDSAVAGWDYRDGTQLCIEIVDPSTDRVRAKYTNQEFNIVMVEDAIVNEVLDMLNNIVGTTKLLNTSLDKDVSKQIYVAFGVLLKLLPTAYANGKKNYNNVINQVRQQIGVTGYQGNFGMNGMMFAGQFGQMPNYYVQDNSLAPNMGFNPNPQPQGGGIDPSVLAQAVQIVQQANAGMGMPTAPTGGTMMGGNPFVQGGQPQQVPQMTGPSVPFPGQQQTQQPNPAIGGGAATATAPF